MTSKHARVRLESAASRALEMMEDMLIAMEDAADQVASGLPVEEIIEREHQLFLANHEGSKAIVCVWDVDDYYDLLSAAAKETGVHLEDSVRLEVELPSMEFEENMITGGFEAWKGLSVEMRNKPLEDLVEICCSKLKKRGLILNCSFEEAVIFFFPLKVRT